MSVKPTTTNATNRELLTLLAVAWQPLSKSEFNSLLAVDAVAKAFPRLAKLTFLQRQRLLATAMPATAAGNQAWQCPESQREALARDFLARPENHALDRAFSQCLNLLQPALDDQRESLRRDLRNALYSHHDERLKRLYQDYYRHFPPGSQRADDAFSFLDAGLDHDWLMHLPAPLLSISAWEYQTYLTNRLRTSRILEDVIVARRHDLHQSAMLPLVDQMILQGRLSEAEKLLVLCDGAAADLRAAWIAFAHAEYPRSRQLFADTLHAIRQHDGAKTFYFRTVGGLYYIFALLREKTCA